ncbi:M23 family metallopeptidase [Bifidobacterium actinocoloniiforme]|nr:M23 family metallopeptidase [Bifidobacterium actinocoloniiforme]
MPGHRGVDLQAAVSEPILAPESGVISFAGTVGGKDVVSLRIGGLTSSFEPATTQKPLGSRVARGQAFARVEGGSDHCDGRCLHWGLRHDRKSYLDPIGRTHAHRIVLKP